MDIKPELAIQIQAIPHLPGVYQYFDKNRKLLYVGKAKDLSKRVKSYFVKQHDHAKTRLLVRKIAFIEHTVVETETDALLLENNLIKRLQPRYNVLLKDDKSYPWICIKKEAFPRVFSTRRVIKDGSEYFGPYTNIKTVYTLLDLIKGLYKLRTCKYDLSHSAITTKDYRVCLEYHIKNCEGPCEGLETPEHYQAKIEAVRNILKGNFKENLKDFREQMQELAANLQFEEAQEIKEKLESLENYQAKSTVVNTKISNVDVFSIISDQAMAYVNFLQIINGAIIRSHTLELKKKMDESDQDLLTLAVVELRERFQLQAKELIVPFVLDLGDKISCTVPQLGDKKRLLDLSERNAKYYRLNQIKQEKFTDPDQHITRIMQQMKKDLRLPAEPRHIECFDNSNIQGTNPVAACVVFKNGKPSKKDYRHYHIKTVEGPDDFASMEEVVYRRYKRLLDEEKPLPQLIVIDGGKGQLSSALKSIDALGLRGKIAILGIAKRLEEIYFPGDTAPLYLDKKSETLKVIQNARNEAHRFGITFHRNTRSKKAVHSVLDEVPGVGEKTRDKLLAKFKSVKRLKDTPLEDVAQIVGKDKAAKILSYLNQDSI